MTSSVRRPELQLGRAARWVASLVLALASGASQQAAVQPVAFDVASVKVNPARDGDRDGNVTASQLRMTYVTLRDLIHFAYVRPNGNLRSDAEVIGGPVWLASSHFDVVATVSGMPAGLDTANTAAGAVTQSENSAINRVRQMMQTLLADRFKLAVHHEMREFPVYELAFARRDRSPGGQLRKVGVNCAELRQRALANLAAELGAPCGGFRRLMPGHFEGHGVSMELLADLLEGIVDRNVTDRTGVGGVFDVDLQFVPDQFQRRDATDDAPASVSGPSIFTAVREQLGLALNSSRGMVDVLVIDRAQMPTPD